MSDRTLGDVPGLDGLLPDGAVLPTGYSVTEVNALGDVTADPTMLSDVLDGVLGMGGDPFAAPIGFMDPGSDPFSGGGGGGGGMGVAHDPMASSYMPTVDQDGNVHGAVVTQGFDADQIDNARIISEVGRKLGASDRDIQIALMTGLVESGLRNLNYGDRDSLGIFQQRDAWGSAQDRTNPAKAAEMFFKGGHAGQRGLFDIPDRDKMSMGEAAQAVQVSAYPDRYAQHQDEAAQLMGAIGTGGSSSGGGSETFGTHGDDPYGLTKIDGKTVDNITAAALAAASKEFGGGLHIMQGSHNAGGVAASGGTHDGGGVVDIAPANGDWEGALTALRKIGFAAWIRNMPGYGQAGSGAHIHAVLIGDKQLSPEAAQQVQSYFNNDDGLAGSRADDGPRQFVGNRFVWGQRDKSQSQGAPSWRDQVLKQAKTYLGTPFKWGGTDYTGVDTEGLIRGIYSKVGLDMPHTADDIATLVSPIAVEEAKPGDLIGWGNHPETGGYHYGVYLGNGQMIEAGVPGRVVQVNSIGHNALAGAFGIPIQHLIDKPPVDPFKPKPVVHEVNHASVPATAYNTYQTNVYSNPGTVTHTTNPTTGHSMVEPHASIPHHTSPHHHTPTPHGLGANNPDKPHAPGPNGDY